MCMIDSLRFGIFQVTLHVLLLLLYIGVICCMLGIEWIYYSVFVFKWTERDTPRIEWNENERPRIV